MLDKKRRKQPELLKSRVLDRIHQGKYVLCGSPAPYPSPKITEMMGLIGFDCAWIDMEHQDYSYDQVFNMCLAARATGMDAMVRIRKEGDHSFYRAFEAGATGVMVPHVKSVDEARWALKNCRFHPKGLRGMDGIEAASRYSLVPMMDYMRWTVKETFVIFQIEDKESLDVIDEITQLDGLDGLFLGPADMSQALGIPCQFDHPKMQEVRKSVAETAEKHGKFWGMPVQNAAHANRLHSEGARFFARSTALFILRDGFQAIRDEFDEAFEG